MDVATIRDAGQRDARAELDQFTADGGLDALAEAAWEPGGYSRREIAEQYGRWIEEERRRGDGARGVRERFRELGGIAPARQVARLLEAVGRWLRPREHPTPPAGFRNAFTLPETPTPAETTIVTTPFRIPRYMDHPEWRPR